MEKLQTVLDKVGNVDVREDLIMKAIKDSEKMCSKCKHCTATIIKSDAYYTAWEHRCTHNDVNTEKHKIINLTNYPLLITNIVWANGVCKNFEYNA
jgi:hypothetical protein